jgi:parallel beta-helix repeat protein
VENNFDDDIAFVDKWIKEMNPEFFIDHAKNASTRSYLNTVNNLRDAAEYRLFDYENHLNEEYSYTVLADGITSTPREYKHFVVSGEMINSFIYNHPQFTTNQQGISLPHGSYHFTETLVIPRDTHLSIAPGTTIYMAPGTSIISYSPIKAIGTPTQPITVLPAKSDKPWGVFGVVNTEGATSTFSHIRLSKGGEDTINEVYYSGMLALHNANGVITNSVFENAEGDDGVNTKGGFVIIENNIFKNNYQDGIDIDFVQNGSKITNCMFENNGGDSIDLSWSNILISQNNITGSKDKCISIGESSTPTITENILSGCDIGIAVKDSSVAKISGNTITNNRIGVSLYQKKPYFGGGVAELFGNVMEGNDRATSTDSISNIVE